MITFLFLNKYSKISREVEKKNKNQEFDEYGRENLWRGSEDSSLIVIDFFLILL